eukprot:s3508_g5.t2
MQITISREQHLKARNVFFARVANVADVRIKCEARSPMAQFWPDLAAQMMAMAGPCGCRPQVQFAAIGAQMSGPRKDMPLPATLPPLSHSPTVPSQPVGPQFVPQRDSPQGAATLNQPSRPQPAQTQMQTPQSSQAPSTTLTSQPASFPAYPSPSHVPKAPAQIQQSPTQLQPSAPVRLQPQQAVQPQYESCPQAVPLQPPQTPQPAPVQPAQPALQTLPQQPQQQHPGGSGQPPPAQAAQAQEPSHMVLPTPAEAQSQIDQLQKQLQQLQQQQQLIMQRQMQGLQVTGSAPASGAPPEPASVPTAAPRPQPPVPEAPPPSQPMPQPAQPVLPLPVAPASPPAALQVEELVEAQCAGWGDDWFPAKVRELLPNNEVQVLWEGEEPSISNVALSMVRRRGSGDATGIAERASACEPMSQPLAAAPAAPADPAAAPPPQTLPQTELEAPSRKRPAAEAVSSGPLMAVCSRTATSVEVDGPLLEFSLRPGMEFSEAFANLRRRLELELKEGRKLSVRLRVVRPPPEPTSPPPPGEAPPGEPPPGEPPGEAPANSQLAPAPPGPPETPKTPPVLEASQRPVLPKDKGAVPPNFPSGPRSMPQKGWWRPSYGGYGKGNGFRAPSWT